MIEGLWRENAAGSKVVYDYYEQLKNDAMAESAEAFFDLKDRDIGEDVKVDTGTGDTHFAYPWKMILPLPEANKVKFTK